MEKRRLGKTGHMSSVVAFGSAALWKVSQAEADAAIELAMEHGVNHFDVAPSYGQAEVRLGPWMEKHHNEIFNTYHNTWRVKPAVFMDIHKAVFDHYKPKKK